MESLTFIFLLSMIILAFNSSVFSVDASQQPIIHDDNLSVQVVFEGLKFPTSMVFLGPDDILVTEKNEGTVKRIVDGKMLPEPLLDVNVATELERGMLGMAVSEGNNTNTTRFVFLYYTEAESADGEDALEGKTPLGNRVYRYELVDGKLTNPKLLVDLPAKERKYHNGGVIEIGPDKNLYVAVGSVAGDKINNNSPKMDDSKILNVKNGPDADGRGGILKITPDGTKMAKGIIGPEYPLNLYYAYGMRNSYGIDFDPVSGRLWDTENGPANSDEINLVDPGFNSGWKVIPGGASSNQDEIDIERDLVDFDGRGKYSEPEFVWDYTVAPTEITFLDSDKYGTQYVNDMFVGDYNNGYVYHFDLNEERTALSIVDMEAKSLEELHDMGIVFGEGFNGLNTKGEGADVIFNQGFGGVTDIEVGPDGYLYVLSIGKGTIYRIVPSQG